MHYFKSKLQAKTNGGSGQGGHVEPNGHVEPHGRAKQNGAGDQNRLQGAFDALYRKLLDDICSKLGASRDNEPLANQCLNELFLALRERRLHSADEEWWQFVQTCRRHPLMGLLHQDPFTFRAYSKPSGYAGDARMMDFIYGREEQWSPPPAEPIGRRVFNYTTRAPASEGVRSRRAFIAGRIDRLAEKTRQPHVLSIAAGHLREVNLSAAARRGRLGRYVALDADPQSLLEVDRCYGCFGVETVPAKFRGLLNNKLQIGQFDLVYSNGLFDYLEQPIGRRLVSTMFHMLRPRGRLIVANFLPGIHDVGYMEAFMDWRLIYRTRREMVDLTMEIPEAEIRKVKLFAEEQQNIIFLEVTRN